MSLHRFGWKPDLPDKRDLVYKAPPKVLKALPPKIDLRSQMPAVFDQGDLGSCTANSTVGQLWHLELVKTPGTAFMPSRLFQYYVTRAIEGTVKQDSGATIRDAIKASVRNGFCPEVLWPYVVNKFAKRPPIGAFRSAGSRKIRKYHRVPQVASQIKSALAQGHTVNFGFTVYESFESDSMAQTGIMTMPEPAEQVLGGHATLIVGYDDDSQWYIVRNSWGDSWGDKGYFYMPYAFAHDSDFASDFWAIDAVP